MMGNRPCGEHAGYCDGELNQSLIMYTWISGVGGNIHATGGLGHTTDRPQYIRVANMPGGDVIIKAPGSSEFVSYNSTYLSKLTDTEIEAGWDAAANAEAERLNLARLSAGWIAEDFERGYKDLSITDTIPITEKQQKYGIIIGSILFVLAGLAWLIFGRGGK